MSVLDKAEVLGGGGTINVRGKMIDTSSRFVSARTGGELPSICLEQHPRGKLSKASDEYFTIFHINSQNKVSRTQADYKFLPVVSTTEATAKEKDKRVKLATSVKKSVLRDDKGISREDIYHEILKHQDEFDELEISTAVSKDSKKEVLLDTLIDIRTRIFKHFPEKEEELKREALLCCSSSTSVESRSSALDSVWHKQPESVRTEEAFNTKYNL
mmetsp:Transcript_36051/g.78957  ORF Transcript_36051/g.78957 Transcript_36051/m.78957 type:complete len:215 (+) Transcript_36051:485-1129(+)